MLELRLLSPYRADLAKDLRIWNIQYLPFQVDRMPKIMQFALDLEKNLIEEFDITGFFLLSLNVIGVILTEFQAPLNRLIGDNDTPSGMDFFGIKNSEQSRSTTTPYG